MAKSAAKQIGKSRQGNTPAFEVKGNKRRMKFTRSKMTGSSESRVRNSIRNAATSVGGQLLNNLLRFICRTVFIYTLGKEFLGISSLYTNILTLLSISELGFSSAVTFSLYKPLAENDRETIRSLMAFYKKAYRVIGLIIFGVGMCLMPFLPKLMTGVTDKVNIYLYYFLYLMQTVVSYLFYAYKAVLLTADQKKYISDLISYFCQIVMNVLQIIVLFTLRSFFIYTVLLIAENIVANLLVAAAADRHYPYIHGSAKPLSDGQKKDIFSRVYAMALYKVSSAVGTATDNLIISAWISVAAVGIYNNYYMIIQVFQNLLTGVFQSVSASVGNQFVGESRDRNAFIFRCLNLANNFLVTMLSVCFLTVFQPFITIWIGKDYLLADSVLWIVVYNFATNYYQYVVQIYREATGVFVKGKYRAVATAVSNLIISIILVQLMGIGGVFLGSIISRMATTGWYDVVLVHRNGLQRSPVRFFLEETMCCGLIAVLGITVNRITALLFRSSWVLLITRGVLSIVLTAAVFWLIYGRSGEFAYLKNNVMKRFLKRRKKTGDN